MSAEVHSQSASLTEFFATVFTFIRLFARVGSHMRFDVLSSPKLLFADQALEGLFSGMRSEVYLKESRLNESLTALRAFERFLSSVGSEVHAKGAHQTELFTAHRTLKVLLPSVSKEMLF